MQACAMVAAAAEATFTVVYWSCASLITPTRPLVILMANVVGAAVIKLALWLIPTVPLAVAVAEPPVRFKVVSALPTTVEAPKLAKVTEVIESDLAAVLVSVIATTPLVTL